MNGFTRAPLAYKNESFLDSDDARPLRILAEYLQPLYAFQREQICGTVVFWDAPERETVSFGAALLTRMVAAQAGYEPGELVWTGGDTHLYLNHIELVEKQLSREPAGDPRLELVRRPDSIFGYRFEDFAVTGYSPQGRLSAPVAV